MVMKKDQSLADHWQSWANGKAQAVAVAKAALAQQRSRSVDSLWSLLQPAEHMARFIDEIARISGGHSKDMSWSSRAVALDFLCLAFRCLEINHVRKEIFRFVSISIWAALSPPQRLELELARNPSLAKLWKRAQKKASKAGDQAEQERLELERTWLPKLIVELHDLLLTGKAPLPQDQALYVCRLIQLLVELENQLPTRRFVHALLEDHGLLLLCEQAIGRHHGSNQTLCQWLDLLRVFILFDIDEHSGQAMKDGERRKHDEAKLVRFQRLAFSKYREHLLEAAMAPLDQVQDPSFLRPLMQPVPKNLARELAETLCVRTADIKTNEPMAHEAVVDGLVRHFARQTSPLSQLSHLPLYPLSTHALLDGLVPPLSLQYLSLSDYLFRHYILYRKESGYAIRGDIEEAVSRLRPAWDDERETTFFRGRARMAMNASSFTLSSVGKMAVFDRSPSHVEMNIRYSLAQTRREVAREWDSLARGEVVFLVSVTARPQVTTTGATAGRDRDAAPKFAISHIRAGTVDAVLAADGLPLYYERDPLKLTADMADPFTHANRTLRVLLDRHQYHQDMLAMNSRGAGAGAEQGDGAADVGDDVYGTFNVLVRRDRRENNFWAILEAIRDGFDCTQKVELPPWLADVYLGFGDPRSVRYDHFEESKRVYFHDTFVSKEHLEASFPGKTIEFDGTAADQTVLEFGENTVRVKREETPAQGTFHTSYLPPENKIAFTPTQVEAIRSGSSPGLTMIVGPPGTGKTDVAVQILCNLYHGRPSDRILLLTHSNQALNQLFEKLLYLNHIPERHLLRLGHADDDLISQYDQYGRVSHFMERRVTLLQQVDSLAKALNIPGDHAFSCETADSFFKAHIQYPWQHYWQRSSDSAERLRSEFPFSAYFTLLREDPVFRDDMSLAEAQHAAQDCWAHLKELFNDVAQSRAFEVLKTDSHKANLLIARDARIVAMTTTYASLKRRDLLDLGFSFDAFVMEEAGTVLEIEAFIPLALSKRVRTVVLIGDNHQLPPVVQCPELQPLTESLFVRLLRLGVPSITLDRQGRTRRSICALYQHVYPDLDHLPQVDAMTECNPGFQYEYQFVDVGDFQGQGEMQPVAHYYQNLGEAEYVVAVYQYMRLLGYPSASIVILTTYNGQRALIKEVLSKRCAWNPELFGACVVTTVDKYQGQQCDYVLLSLVRTRHVGHFADLRRLVVAMSRARRGLYLFGRRQCFANVRDLQPTLNSLTERPAQLVLVPGERYTADQSATRPVDQLAPEADTVQITDIDAMGEVVATLAQQVELENMDVDA